MPLMIGLAALQACSPSPEEGDPVTIITPVGDMDGMEPSDSHSRGGEQGDDGIHQAEDLGQDASTVRDASGTMDAGVDQDTRTVDMGADLVDMSRMEEMGQLDMGPSPVAFTELTETSIQQLFPGKQPGHLPASRTMRIFHSQELGVHVGLDERSGWTVAEVARTFESLAMFRRELPETYLPLFELSNQGEMGWLRRPQQAPWTNTNLTGAFVILSDDFQSAGATMATNFYALGQAGAGSVYANVPFLNVRPEVIEGAFQGVGPGPIYPGLTAAQARDEYLKEGLADSLLHERLHAFISQFYAHDELFAELRDGTSCAYALEELLVRRHLTYYYMRRPDLFSQAHTSYWTQDLNLLSNQVEQSPCYGSFMNRGWLVQPLLHVPHVP